MRSPSSRALALHGPRLLAWASSFSVPEGLAFTEHGNSFPWWGGTTTYYLDEVYESDWYCRIVAGAPFGEGKPGIGQTVNSTELASGGAMTSVITAMP
jgi:hypothetical protein